MSLIIIHETRSFIGTKSLSLCRNKIQRTMTCKMHQTGINIEFITFNSIVKDGFYNIFIFRPGCKYLPIKILCFYRNKTKGQFMPFIFHPANILRHYGKTCRPGYVNVHNLIFGIYDVIGVFQSNAIIK